MSGKHHLTKAEQHHAKRQKQKKHLKVAALLTAAMFVGASALHLELLFKGVELMVGAGLYFVFFGCVE